MQIIFRVLCTAAGCPITIEVFACRQHRRREDAEGPDRQAARERFGLYRVVLVGDRGMITQARITEELQPAGLDWITALRAPDIQALAAADGPLQIILFDERIWSRLPVPITRASA